MLAGMSAASLDAMMGDYAQAAVEMGRAMNLTLDYSEDSLQDVERILSQLYEEARDQQIADSASAALGGQTSAPDAAAPSTDQMKEMCKLWGSYFGEVLRRRWGGEWNVETYPGGNFSTLTVNIEGMKIFPSMKVYRRLTQGAQENLWEFYQTVRQRLSAGRRGQAVQ